MPRSCASCTARSGTRGARRISRRRRSRGRWSIDRRIRADGYSWWQRTWRVTKRAKPRAKRHLTLLKSEPDAVLSSPEDEIDADTRARRVRVALDQLTPRDREALLLWDAGMSYDEIAAQTGLARGAIGTTLARARRRLVEAYDAGLEGGQHVARG